MLKTRNWILTFLLSGFLFSNSWAVESGITPQITVTQLNDYLTFFYDGRNTKPTDPDNWLFGSALKLGIGSYAIHQGNKAVIYDTFLSLEHARWIRNYLEQQMGIKHITVIQSHWHLDHIAGNEIYKDCDIVSLKKTREIMKEKQAALESGAEWGPPEINPMIAPNAVFETRMDMYVGDIKLELHQFNIHSPDANLIYLPKDKILLAGDALEDTVTYMVSDHVPELPTHLKELQRLKAMDIAKIYPNHGNPNVIRNGGYNKTFIDATINYITRMIQRVKEPNYLQITLEDIIGDSLEKGWVTLFEPYRVVHEANLKYVHDYYANKPLPDLGTSEDTAQCANVDSFSQTFNIPCVNVNGTLFSTILKIESNNTRFTLQPNDTRVITNPQATTCATYNNSGVHFPCVYVGRSNKQWLKLKPANDSNGLGFDLADFGQ
ncbi:MAG: Beta-lactamase precursor [Pseudomonadota bacterium]|jgi:glyoxylase-like metal-dependent hydrolase (beta-lactamase superfamily II)